MMKNHLHLLRSKRFLPLFITQFFGAFNDNAFKNAFLIWFTYEAAAKAGMNAPMMLTLAAGIFILPFFLFSVTAGQLADKYEKSRLTRKIKFVEIVLMLSCAFFFFFGSIYGLLVILFLMGVQSTFFGPIKYSLLPEHLEKEELIGGNALIESGTFLSILLGTIFGGVVVSMSHGVVWLSFFVILFALIGWISSRSIPRSSIGDQNLKIGWNLARETGKVIGYARENRRVWFCIIGISWFWLIGATFLTQLPVYTKTVIAGNTHIVTLFLSLFSVGIGVGSLACNRLLKGEVNARLVPYGAVGITVAIVIFYFASWQYQINHAALLVQTSVSLGIFDFFGADVYSSLIAFSLLMLAVCGGLYTVPLYAIMQRQANDHCLARIVAANNVMNALFMVLSSVVAMLFFAVGLTVTEILLIVGLLNILMYFLLRRELK